MSVAPLHTHAFFEEVLKTGFVWAIQDEAGFPTSTNQSNETAMPFWSSQARAQLTIDRMPAYRSFKPHRLPLDVFVDRWLTGLEKDTIMVGINWSGAAATGFDLPPTDVRRWLHEMQGR
ncbi:DUF2750 domain-containing protein [Ensifer adhaerens]|uniref:DUF2750 domain-containing protein n=1 Tax=Ensifer adhaerens TaxID=106592 RepID=UPI001CBB99CF|nr:DUF2750 domain-containing protein [Ensifer adhaerens]MBZ7922192.1 DUF2750 domain-containing protein [Ensifer adhaerens]UAX90840.1 DUF2750 domain-containing protein [Ensifer adhaerens]UAX98469.1 DUF2750 domain-containing protein [Ensifer adhaerens]UAY05850.1 DUF2750 domain-containing protein [Ensifer adhaerens]